MLRPAIVTDVDREWALRQCPPWARRFEHEDQAGEIVDDDRPLDLSAPEAAQKAPVWDYFVTEQAERFEKYFAGELKTYKDWSNLWRKGWWPKANPERSYPGMAKKKLHPFFRAGTAEFIRALKVATPAEAAMWKRFKVAQLNPEDPRLAQIVKPVTATSDQTKRIVKPVTSTTDQTKRIVGERD